jgi:hypothetical protein
MKRPWLGHVTLDFYYFLALSLHFYQPFNVLQQPTLNTYQFSLSFWVVDSRDPSRSPVGSSSIPVASVRSPIVVGVALDVQRASSAAILC